MTLTCLWTLQAQVVKLKSVTQTKNSKKSFAFGNLLVAAKKCIFFFELECSPFPVCVTFFLSFTNIWKVNGESLQTVKISHTNYGLSW